MAAAVSEQSAPEVAVQYVGPWCLRQEIWIGFDSTTIVERERKVRQEKKSVYNILMKEEREVIHIDSSFQ